MRLKLILLLIFSFLNDFQCLALKNVPCVKLNHCFCQYPNGAAIDLRPFNISSSTNFTLFASNNSVAYLYQPCMDVTVGNASEKAALWKFTASNSSINGITLQDVLTSTVNGTLISLGGGDAAEFVDTEFNIQAAKITYSMNDMKSIVALKCNKYVETSLKMVEELSNPYVNSLVLTSPLVCEGVPETHGLSSGSVFVLILFIIMGLYLVGGMLVKKYLMGATGVEMIPNIDFWKSLPGLVKDGFLFAITCGKATQNLTYEQI